MNKLQCFVITFKEITSIQPLYKYLQLPNCMFYLRIFLFALFICPTLGPAGLLHWASAQSTDAFLRAVCAPKYLHKELLFNSFMPCFEAELINAAPASTSHSCVARIRKIIAHFLPTPAVSSIAATLLVLLVWTFSRRVG